MVPAVGAWLIIMLATVGCTRSEWDTSAADDALRSTTTVAYTRDAEGVRRSLVDGLSRPADNFNEWSPSEAEAECAADRLLRRFGADRMLEAGYEPGSGSLAVQWTAAEQSATTNILVGCIDFASGLVELLVGYDKVPLPVAACIGRGGERRQIPRLLAATLVVAEASDPFANDGELARGLAELTVECLGPTDLLPDAPVAPLPDGQRNDVGEDFDTTSVDGVTTTAP